MLKDRNIAFFIDLYNTELSTEHFDNIVDQLSQMGKILSGTIYGAGERTHKDVLAQADVKGYKTVRTPRTRGRKVFDARILVDVVDKVNRSTAIDAVCIVANTADMVYLYSYLRELGIQIISLANCDDASNAFVDEIIDSGKVEKIKLPRTAPKRKAKPAESVAPVVVPAEPVAEPAPVVVEQPVSVAEPIAEPASAPVEPTMDPEMARMDQLLKEIDRLRNEVEQPAEEPQPEPQPVETPVEEPVVEPAPQPVEEPAEEPQPVEQPTEEPAPEQPSAPRASYAPQDDADLIRKIEQMRQSSQDTDQLIDEIKKLLDDIE